MKREKPILIQGAMQVEIDYLIEQLENLKKVDVQGYEFYEGEIEGYPVVISKTSVGGIQVSVATLLGILTYHPKIVINQGIAGAIDLNLYNHDMVVGTSCMNVNSFETKSRKKGEGSNPFDWELKTFKDGKDELIEINADIQLVEISKVISNLYTKGRVVFGKLGSGDIWNKEWDRIEWFHKNYHTLCADMESINTYTICNQWKIPIIGIRSISDNARIDDQIYDRTTSIDSQEFTIELCKEYIRRIK